MDEELSLILTHNFKNISLAKDQIAKPDSPL